MTNQHTQRDFSKHWQREVKEMRTRKQEKKEKRRKTRFAKGTKERKQRDNQKIRTKKRKQRWKKEEKNKSNKKWLARSHGMWSIACDVPHVLRGNLLVAVSNVHSSSPNLFYFVELTFSCWVAYFEPAFLCACSLELVNVWKSVVCRGNKIVFVCLLRWLHDLFVCTSPASCLASTIQLVHFSVRFLLLRLCVFLSSWIYVPISLLAVSLLVCEALATLVYFSGAVGDTWRSRHCRYVHLRVFRFAPRVALACSVSFPSPCLFLLHRLRWLLLGQGRCPLGRPWWILASLSTSCWNSCGCEHRDGFWLGFFLPSLLSAGCSFLPPDVVRASSLWHVLRILTLFLALTGTMALHVLKLCLPLLGMSDGT